MVWKLDLGSFLVRALLANEGTACPPSAPVLLYGRMSEFVVGRRTHALLSLGFTFLNFQKLVHVQLGGPRHGNLKIIWEQLDEGTGRLLPSGQWI
jgi:hypothetical protein